MNSESIRKAGSQLAPLVRGLFLNEYAVPVVVSAREPDTGAGAIAGSDTAAGAGSVKGAGVAADTGAGSDARAGNKVRLLFAVPEWFFADEGFDETRAAAILAEEFSREKHKIGNTASGLSLVLEWDSASLGFQVWFPEQAALPDSASTESPFISNPANPNSAIGREKVVAGKVAVVTGGAQGFGEEIVRGLAASGAYVFIADMNLDGATKLAYAINSEHQAHRDKGLPGPAFPIAVNVTDEASVVAMFRAIAGQTGGLDLIVSNAGVLKAGSVLEQDEKSFRFVTDVNYLGFFLIAKHGGQLLRRQYRTAPRWMTDIIQINSKSGLAGSNKNGAYAGSKFGGIGLVQSYALELVEYSIKVNAICPGNFFDGPLWSDPKNGLFVQYLNSGKVPGAASIADVRAFYEAKVPMKRGTSGKDVMRALYYLVEQEYETGQALPVTGGQVMLR